MRTLTLTCTDLSQLYQAEAHLTALGDVLQRMELRHASQLDDLRTQVHNAAVRLENSDTAGVSLPGEALTIARPGEGDVKRVYIVQPEPPATLPAATEHATRPLKPFIAGMLTMLAAAALPPEKLSGWHQGMTELQQLANRLNALDEQRGKYMTVSELQSAVFTMMQAFNSAVPAEEQLRQLSELPQNQPWPAAQQSQTEQHLQQLTARYALLKQKTVQ